jgi:hypothetical protein
MDSKLEIAELDGARLILSLLTTNPKVGGSHPTLENAISRGERQFFF